MPFTPLMMNYKTMIDKDSMYNTPPCWCIYMLGLILTGWRSRGAYPAWRPSSTKRRRCSMT